MKLSIYESALFSRNREEYFGNDEGFRLFQNALLDNPRFGPVIPGCGGVRKIRWPAFGQGKGKRGGLRIIYLYVEEADVVLLMLVYTKNDAEDLTPDEKNVSLISPVCSVRRY